MGNYNISCKNTMRNYLLNKLPLYSLRWPIAILITIIAINVLINVNCDFPRPLLYVLAFVVCAFVLIIIYLIAGASFSNQEYDHLVRKCQLCIADPHMKNVDKMTAEDFANYSGQIEDFDVTDFETVPQEDGIKSISDQPVERVMARMNESGEEEVLDGVVEEFNPKLFIDDRMFHETQRPLGDSFPTKRMSYKPLNDDSMQTKGSKCLLGSDGCNPLCSEPDPKNPCNLVAPVPGPNWQPQSAAAVQERLTKQQYVPSNCPLGPNVLRMAPDCQNIKYDDDRKPQQVTCYAAQKPEEFK